MWLAASSGIWGGWAGLCFPVRMLPHPHAPPVYMLPCPHAPTSCVPMSCDAAGPALGCNPGQQNQCVTLLTATLCPAPLLSGWPGPWQLGPGDIVRGWGQSETGDSHAGRQAGWQSGWRKRLGDSQRLGVRLETGWVTVRLGTGWGQSEVGGHSEAVGTFRGWGTVRLETDWVTVRLEIEAG